MDDGSHDDKACSPNSLNDRFWFCCVFVFGVLVLRQNNTMVAREKCVERKKKTFVVDYTKSHCKTVCGSSTKQLLTFSHVVIFTPSCYQWNSYS